MEQSLAAVIILVEESGDIGKINGIISDHSEIILGRQGIPLRERACSVISLVLEGNGDRLGSLTGKLGRLPGVKVKSVMAG
jgi:putative iron-only hydrogenase system regulator